MAEETVKNLSIGRRRNSPVQRYSNKRVKQHQKYANKMALSLPKPCSHNKKFGYECDVLNIECIVRNRQLFYKNEGKVKQDQYLALLVKIRSPKRTKLPKSTDRKFACSYFLKRRNKWVKVCQGLFLKVFSITGRRINTIAKSLFRGDVPQERRGGKRISKKFERKRDSVLKFLSSLPAKESHYNRSKSRRCYLSSEYSIAKLRNIYNDSIDDSLKVKPTYFWNVFNTFNIGFSSPASDVCSQCTLKKQKIKISQNTVIKQQLITQQRIHKLRANSFYELARAEPCQSLSFCFDLQQVQPLPRTSIQEAFYSRQLGYYTMCVVDMKSQKPTFYTWTEDQAGRGAVSVGSALIAYFDTINLLEINTLRLFCDGCGGQNKNMHIIHLIMHWMLNNSPPQLKEIQLYFPVRGHSFLPADRVFGRVERDLRKCNNAIFNVEDYHKIYARHGHVRQLGKDWLLKDIKELAEFYRPMKGIQNMKRIYFKISEANKKQCVIKTFDTYRVEDTRNFKSYLKKGKNPPDVLGSLSIGQPISTDKKNDVIKLLQKHYGSQWSSNPALSYYKRIFFEHHGELGNDNEDGITCDCLEDDISSQV